MRRSLMTPATLLGVAAVVLVAAAVLLGMGRVPICTCGTVKLWHGVVFSSENSQHLSDWYSFTHVVHGFAFYGLLWLVGRRWPMGIRLIAATAIEGAWEILENTNMVIERYREVTISLDYFGDSVINSVSDIVAMVLGFVVAARLPVWASVAMVAGLEIFLLIAIRDNLALNLLMLLAPIDAVREWQSAVTP
ncbi:MAG: DUF2585 domain-containing protein [Acidobacteria bacterium]|nr:DUF2585 domain-containing protein [Acidobacteriota bacterium]